MDGKNARVRKDGCQTTGQGIRRTVVVMMSGWRQLKKKKKKKKKRKKKRYRSWLPVQHPIQPLPKQGKIKQHKRQ
ncbi:hypothetical protein L249_4848 [Ophiocordyceps polyrhachis-furcata BCC 54312]|uniref:Uncharacterized protein n=1 Tax=Ophiocordyceps polyrhachis-furcata BCC 54312 TaxID=1330021 RepID=A0A367L2H0_9HYPO|nr:hypothetical protein L249_4848 [Ophiocordyceps polyrhachis-furcata BCC 54312]